MPLNVVRHEAVHLYAAPPSSSSGMRAVDAILQLHKAEDDAIESARLRTSLSASEFCAVRYLLQARRDARPVSPKDLAVMLGRSNAAITQLVDRLERLGYVERQRHTVDRRAQLLVPTAMAAERVDDAFREFHSAIVAAIGEHDDLDTETVARVLDTVFENINASLNRMP